MNGINASPVMLNEEYDSLLCLFRGNKRIILVNTSQYPHIRQVSIQLHYCLFFFGENLNFFEDYYT